MMYTSFINDLLNDLLELFRVRDVKTYMKVKEEVQINTNILLCYHDTRLTNTEVALSL